MTQCCTSSNTKIIYPKKYICPVNGRSYSGISATTILHHINQPWSCEVKQQGYYFCADPECDVVYYGQDDSLILKSELRTTVGIKDKDEESLICYCFGVTKKMAIDEKIKKFVINSTKEKICACSTRNPSGKCCLKDFPK